MGAAKFPEQIGERIEAGLRETDKLDPVIERLRAQPVSREISPEESNVHRPLSAGVSKGARKVASRLVVKQRLQRIYGKIDRLRSSDPSLITGEPTLDEQISLLRKLAGKLRSKSGRTKKPKRSKKHR